MPPPDLYARPHAVAFLRDVIDHPDDDTPRLIFADWLEDHGDAERAEFIRLQIEREKLPPHSLRSWQLLVRERKLERQHGEQWRGKLPAITSETTFRRGFVEDVKLGVRQFMDHAAELFAQTPVRRVHLLRLTHSTLGVSELVSSGLLQRLSGLNLRGSNVGDRTAHGLLSALESETLEELDLTQAGLGAAALIALASAKLPRLRTLRLGQNPLLGLLYHLTRSQPAYAVRELDLSNAALTQTEVERLWGWPAVAQVESLDLSGVRLGVRGTQVMTSGAGLGQLKQLDLTNSAIGQGGARALAGCAALANLEVLRLNGNALKRPGLEALLASPHLTRLAELQVASNELGDGAASLANWPHLAGVTTLNVGNNKISTATVEALAGSSYLGTPTSLSFFEERIGAEGIYAIADCPKMAGLHALLVSQCGLADAHVEPLLKSPHLGSLWELDLRFNRRLSDGCLARLKERFGNVLT